MDDVSTWVNGKKSFWHWIQQLLDRWLCHWSALSPKNTWQLSQLVPAGCSAIWCSWGTLQHSKGIIHFSLEITPAIHRSKVLKTTECNYWKSIIVTVLNNTPLIQPGQKKIFIRAHILLRVLSCCSSMASNSEMKLQKHLWHLLVLVFYVFWFRLKLYLIWPWNNFQKWSFFSSSFDFVIFPSLCFQSLPVNLWILLFIHSLSCEQDSEWTNSKIFMRTLRLASIFLNWYPIPHLIWRQLRSQSNFSYKLLDSKLLYVYNRPFCFVSERI